MINEKFVKEQVGRLSRLQNFPSRPDEAALRSDLVRALAEAPTEESAREIVEAWLAESDQSPTISQLRAAVRARQEPKAFGCRACNGTGFLLRRDALGREWASPCNCRKGAAA